MLIISIFNVISLIPYSFTITSHYSITIGMSITTLISCSSIGIIRNSIEFLNLFLPNGTPILL